MEGKKIAFIVVAIVAVGGVGYYLYKRNKDNAQVVQAVQDTKSSFLNKKDKLKELSKIASNPTRVVQDALPIVSSDYDGADSRKVNI